MKLILCDRRANAPVPGEPGAKAPVLSDQEKKIAAVVADFRGNPAVFGVEIGDEPSPANLDTFLTCARLTKAAAPEWHPFINHLPYYSPGLEKATKYPTWSDVMDLLAKAAKEGNLDLLCYDCYAQMLEDPLGIEIYYGNLRLFREGARRTGLPFWNTVLSVPHFVYRAPSYDDLRAMATSSFASSPLASPSTPRPSRVAPSSHPMTWSPSSPSTIRGTWTKRASAITPWILDIRCCWASSPTSPPRSRPRPLARIHGLCFLSQQRLKTTGAQ